MSRLRNDFSEGMELGRGEVHIFAVSTAVSEDVLARLEGLLTEDERVRAARLRIPAKRVEAIVARAVVRWVLAKFLSVTPAEICFSVGNQGKPFLENYPLHFNLSHTAGMVVLAVCAQREIGVDVEGLRERVGFADIAKRFFTPAEYEGIMAMGEGERLAAFFRCWTRKEAILKVTGRGISAGLDTFTVPLGICEEPVMAGGWLVRDLAVGEGFAAALAMEPCDAAVKYWSLHELIG